MWFSDELEYAGVVGVVLTLSPKHCANRQPESSALVRVGVLILDWPRWGRAAGREGRGGRERGGEMFDIYKN